MKLSGIEMIHHLLARSVLEYEPPINAFGGFVLDDGVLDQGSFDVKGVIAQVVGLATSRILPVPASSNRAEGVPGNEREPSQVRCDSLTAPTGE